MERLIMKLEVMGAETLGKLNEHFRKKVQLEEQQKENEALLHFHRGVLFGIQRAQEVAKEIQKGEQIETMETQLRPDKDAAANLSRQVREAQP